MENGTETTTPHIVMVPTPGMGHLIPLAELAKLPVSKHGFTIHSHAHDLCKQYCIQHPTAFLSSLPSSISTLSLPPVSLSDLPSSTAPEAPRDAGLRSYLFFPTNLLALSLVLHLPEIDANLTCEFKELTEPVQLPGCVPVPGTEIPSPLQDRSNECYKWMLYHGKKYGEADAILMRLNQMQPIFYVSQSRVGRQST
ncbi:Glycosyltransferase [Rhynchospora pubera]|uniref:Glycosyltransferase n=1 Tax=Rhynchospora pubera TaxID=906938 RepID=A0AAV8FMW7_9POAL|nr:Glycosyltransferase [Rhynchospora pubera]